MALPRPGGLVRGQHADLRGPALPGLPAQPLLPRRGPAQPGRAGAASAGRCPGGTLVDAVDRRRLVLAADVGLAACSAALLGNATLGHPLLWLLFVVAAAMGACAAVQRPSLDALLPRLVPVEDIPAATALTALRSNLGQVAGPAAAGVLIALWGLAVTYGLDAATFAVAFVALGRMRAVPPPPDAGRPSRARIREGLRYARSRPDLLGTYLVDMAAMLFGMPEALFPQLAARLGGAGVLGLLFSAPAVGALVVSATAGWAGTVRRQGRALVFAAAGWGAAVVGLGLAPSLGPALAALAVAGGFDMVGGLMRSTIWNPILDALRGRLAGLELVSFSSGPALGNVEAGLVEALAGLQFSILSDGVACVVATAALAAALPSLWRYDAREAGRLAGRLAGPG
ncbi:MAG TPA: MFS transporter [Candidatus Dormibacteraeota bacterium]|nr:MFS transporter [Candidatus Dormibacteraeota bacterium]